MKNTVQLQHGFNHPGPPLPRMANERKAAAKLRATAYATTSRAISTGATWLGAINEEDLVLQSNDRKKDEDKRRKLRLEQRQRELAAIEAKRVEKQRVRDAREKKRVQQEELEREARARRDLEREERAQRSVEEHRYCLGLLRRFPTTPPRTLSGIRTLLLEFRRNRAKVEASLVADRAARVASHVRWRYRALETIWEALRACNRAGKRRTWEEDGSAAGAPLDNRFRDHRDRIISILRQDERYRRELFLWPSKAPQADSNSGYYEEVLDAVPNDATSPLLDLCLRPNKDRLIHLCCKGTSGGEAPLSVVLGAGASLNIPNNRGILPVHVACQAGCGASVAKLLAHGANGRARVTASGNTPMFFAIENNDMPMVKLLFSILGTDALTDRTVRGTTPLHLAAYFGHTMMVEQMLCWLVRGRNVVVVRGSGDGETRSRGFYNVPGSAVGKRLGMASGFLTAKAKDRGLWMGNANWKEKEVITRNDREGRSHIAAVTERGVTPLMCAAWSRHVSIMSMLAQHMTTEEMALKDTQGHQAKDYARCGHSARKARGVNQEEGNTSPVGRRWILDPIL